MVKNILFRRSCKVHPLQNGKSCDHFTNSDDCKTCLTKRKFTVILKTFHLAFTLVGLNLQSGKKRCNLKSRLRIVKIYFIAIAMHLFLIYRGVVMCFRVEYAGYTIKLAMVLISREVLVLLIWHAVLRQRKKISKLFTKFLLVSEAFIPEMNKNAQIIIYGVLFFIFAFPVTVAVMVTQKMSSQEAKMYEFIAMFGFVSDYKVYFVDFLLYSVYNLYLLPLPCVLASLYVFMSVVVLRMLKFCKSDLNKCGCSEANADKALIFSKKVLSLVADMEDALSPCIFLEIALNLALCFTSFAYALGYYATSPSATVGVLSWCLSNLLLFTVVVWTASDVNSESRSLKETFLMILPRFGKEARRSLMLKMLQLRSTTLTGWQMFDLSRSLIVSSVGVVLTYALLILQINNHPYKQEHSVATSNA